MCSLVPKQPTWISNESYACVCRNCASRPPDSPSEAFQPSEACCPGEDLSLPRFDRQELRQCGFIDDLAAFNTQDVVDVDF